MTKDISLNTTKNDATYVDNSHFVLGLGLSGMVLSLLVLLVKKNKYSRRYGKQILSRSLSSWTCLRFVSGSVYVSVCMCEHMGPITHVCHAWSCHTESLTHEGII
jgi:hypothetical protein